MLRLKFELRLRLEFEKSRQKHSLVYRPSSLSRSHGELRYDAKQSYPVRGSEVTMTSMVLLLTALGKATRGSMQMMVPHRRDRAYT